jgi:uncharacterized protein YqjF (DUF2071 family)
MAVRPIHPVPMATRFRRCVLVNFAIDPVSMSKVLPNHLVPDIHNGMAYMSIVIAKMERMRPAFLPRFSGVTYTQVVYRAIVRCGNARGVTFLRSDADNRLMVAAGNALTFFRFHHATMNWDVQSGSIGFQLCPTDGARASIAADYDLGSASGRMPSTSRFSSLTDAQSFLTELYCAFGAQRSNGRVEAVRIKRSSWHGKVVDDRVAGYEAMAGGSLFREDTASLDSIFLVENLDYHWRRLSLVDSENAPVFQPH